MTDEEVDGDATIPFAFYKSLISSQQYAALTAACNGSFWRPVEGSQCAALVGEAMSEVAKLNLYDILLPCFSGSAARNSVLRDRMASLDSRAHTWPHLGPARAGRMRTWHDILGTELGDTPPCLDHRCRPHSCRSACTPCARHCRPQRLSAWCSAELLQAGQRGRVSGGIAASVVAWFSVW